MPHGGQEGGGVLPNGGGREQRERLPFFSSPLFSSFNCHFSFVQNFPPLFLVFQPSLLFKNSSPPFCSCVKGERGSSMRMGSRGHQARAACAAPMLALLPTPEGLGQRHAHGGNGVYTILGFFLFYFFLFLWGSKNGLQQSHL